MRFGDYLLRHLRRHGVTDVFGIPGVHTAELYRGLAESGIRHVTPRHEQGAGFMADGYARLSGRPGVCFVITGPGVTNIATAMGQAYQDSIPLLVISGVNAVAQLGSGNGNLHELPDQKRVVAGLAAFSHTLLRAEDLPAVLARAFAVFACARPRPVHIEIPTDIMDAEVEPGEIMGEAVRLAAARPDDALLDVAAATLAGAGRPLILAGGGARGAADLLGAVASRLDCPAVMTINGRGLLPLGHPLGVSGSPSLKAIRALIEDSDVVFAAGTEIGRTDYDMYAIGGFRIPGRLIRLDIDPLQMMRGRMPDVALAGDAATGLAAILDRLPPAPARRGGSARAEAVTAAARAELSPAMRRQVEFLETIRDALPDAVIVGDSTQAVYAGNLFFEAGGRAGWFNSAVGYGTLGYALPAAIGAKIAAPERPVICLTGDGGLQFTLAELGSALDAKAGVIILVWNNNGYGEIKAYMRERGIAPEGVDLTTPDFVAIARAYGIRAEKLASADGLTDRLRAAAQHAGPTLIEIDEALIMG